MERQKCPEVRFKGFRKDWAESNLDEISYFSKGSGISKQDIVKGGENPCVRYGEIYTTYGSIIETIVSYTNVDKKNCVLSRSNQVLIPASGETQLDIATASCILKDDVIIGGDLNILTTKQNGIFLANYLSFVKRNEIAQLAQGNSVVHLYAKQLQGLNINYPCLTEQTQIGNYFQNLDQSIALQEKKLVQTQNLKKAMLEKMFPKAGSKQPEIRLKGFSGNWDTINLESLCSIGDIDHRMPESTKSGIPYLMTGDFFGINELDFENAKLISNEDYEQLSKKIKPEIGDILFARYASVGTVRLVVTDMKFLISYSCAILKTSVNSNGEYLFYWFQTAFAQNQIEQEINTGSQRNIGIDSLKKLSVSLPKANEQKAIANFFKQLDETLVLQQQQLQTLKNLKQAFLEKMFV